MCQFIRLQYQDRFVVCGNTYSVINASIKRPQFWHLKIFFLIVIVFFRITNIHASEFDFVLDVSESPAAKQSEINVTEDYQFAPSWRAELNTPILPDFLKGSGELAYGNVNKKENTDYFEWDKYLLKLEGSGKHNAFGYGLNFYSVGENFNGKLKSHEKWKKGKTGYDSWLSWKINKFQIKSKFSQVWKNRLRHDQWVRLESKYSLPSIPNVGFSVSYGLGKKWDTNSNLSTETDAINSYKAQFRYADNYWKFSTEFSRLDSKNKLVEGEDVKKDTFYIKGTLLPEHLLSVISSYRYSEKLETTHESKTRLNKVESSLGVIYKWVEIPGQLKLTSAYNNYQSSDGLTNKDIIKFAAKFIWKIQDSNPDVKTNWSVDFHYKDTKDYRNPDSSASNWSVNLLWRWSLT